MRHSVLPPVAGMIASGATFDAMVQDRPEPDNAESSRTASDDPLAGLRRLAGLAKDLGLTDVASFTDMLDSARNEGRGAEFFKSLRTLLVDQAATSGDAKSSLSDLGERLASWASSSTSGGGASGTGAPRASGGRAATGGSASSGPPPSGTWASSGRETRTEEASGQAGMTEAALLRRIEELSRAATVEELTQLAAAYAEVCLVHGGRQPSG